MSLPRFSVENRVLVNMFMLVIFVAGGMYAITLVREMFPESRPDKLAVSVVYPAEQPQEIEKAVTIKIEEAVRDIDAIEKVDSTIAEGVSNTVLTLYNNVDDIDAVLQEVKSKVDAIQDLPDEIEKTTITKLEPVLPVISVAIFGSGDEAGLKRAAREMRDDLLLLPGVTDVQVTGTRDDEISVEVLQERLLEYGVTFEEVAAAIRSTNVDISGGRLRGDRANISVRTLGEENQGRELEDIVVRTDASGRNVYLRDVANVIDGFIESDLEGTFNSQPAVNCTVSKTSSQDAIQIANLVRAYVYGKQGKPFDPYKFNEAYAAPWYRKPFLLVGAGFSKFADKLAGKPDPMVYYERSRGSPFRHDFDVALHTNLARFVEGRLDLLTRNGQSGLILVLISLMLFLNWRVAFWAAVGLPVSFLGTFIVMAWMGVTFNLLSMFGLIIVLGIIVDDAIVIGENIYRHVEEGMPAMKAAVKGAEEVMWPVIVAVTTTIAAFAPLLFIKGQIGDFMGQLPLVVLAALSVSLLEALMVLPAHLCHLPPPQPKSDSPDGTLARIGAFRDRVLHGWLADRYESLLRLTIRWRYVTLATAVALLMVAGGMVVGGLVPFEFIQKMDSETIMAKLDMPVGTNADVVRERLQTLSETAVAMPEVENVQMFVARQYDFKGAGAMANADQSHLGQLVIALHPADERDGRGERSSTELLAVLREKSAGLPGINSVAWEAMNGGPGGKDLDIRVSGGDFEQLTQAAEELKQELANYRGVEDLDDDYDRGLREVQLRMRSTAESTGLRVGLLGMHVRNALFGSEARRLTRNREDVKIMVRYPERFRKNVYNVESMWIPADAPDGTRRWVPLSEVAELTEAESYATIHRSQQQRSISVFGEVNSEINKPQMITNQLEESFLPKLRERYPNIRVEFRGQAEEMGKAFGSLRTAFPAAMLLVFMLLAGLFRSYVQPVVVMSAIPFGIFGAIIGHWITDNPITILSLIGMVALTGILVNDSLVLVDFINRRVRSGMDEEAASIEGAKLRLRAILLTTATTVAGLTPLMFETSFQAKFLIPMAVTLTFGLLFATALTLIIVPCLNMVFFDFRALRGGEQEHLDKTVS